MLRAFILIKLTKEGIAMKYLTEQLPLFETLHIKDLMTALESLIHK